MQTCLKNKLVWKQVRPLVLLHLDGQGELGLRGDWGPLKFTPQQSKSQVCQDLLLHHQLQLHHRHQGGRLHGGGGGGQQEEEHCQAPHICNFEAR